MEDIISYVVLFVFGLIAVTLYLKHRTRNRDLPLTIQYYPELRLEVSIQKQYGKTQKIIVKLFAKSTVIIGKILVELIDKKRNIESLEIKGENNQASKLVHLTNGEAYHFHFNPEFFQEFLKSQKKPFNTFRFVVVSNKGTKYKSHDLALDKNWSIYKPDSGTYN
jgi:hypothetical protein